MRASVLYLGGGLLLAGCADAAFAEDLPSGPEPAVEQLRSYSLEDLANLQVLSVSKRLEPVSQAAASIYVITADDIARAGATSLPEALRLAPNLEVARINAYAYAITARGMNSAESANKLLVLINGRSVYEPIGSGVLWQQVDVVMSNIARIEVVSGPGGTLWGANAVNGVINVITKTAAETTGFHAQAGGGDLERYADATWGAKLGPGDIRASIQAFRRDGLDKASPTDKTSDGFYGWQASLRYGGGDAQLRYAAIANLYDNRIEHGGGGFWGGSLMGRISAQLAGGSRVDVQAYYAKDDRSDFKTHERRDTYNLQAQQALDLGRHQVVWGGEVRVWREYFLSTDIFAFAEPRATIALGSLFVQDEVSLAPKLTLTAGLKLEDNSYSGLDWLPNVRLAWRPGPDMTFWAAVSRAVRTPNRIERELEAPGILVAAPGFESEILWAYEAGYRGRPTQDLSLSVTAFFNDYDRLRTDELMGGKLPVILRNGADGQSYGVEAWAAWDVNSAWRLKAGLSTLQKDFRISPGHNDISRLQIAGIDPKYQAQLRSQWDVGRNVDIDLGLRWVGQTTRLGVGQNAPAYAEADARVGWKVRPGLELWAAGYNLLHDHHLEINDATTVPTRFVPRSVFAGLRWAF